MLRKVPTATSRRFGTTAVRMPAAERLANLTWLPVVPTSTHPAAINRRLTSRNGRFLSGTHLHLDGPQLWRSRGDRGAEMQRKRVAQVRERRGFAPSLAGNVDFETLRDVPLPFAPDTGGELPFPHAAPLPVLRSNGSCFLSIVPESPVRRNEACRANPRTPRIRLTAGP